MQKLADAYLNGIDRRRFGRSGAAAPFEYEIRRAILRGTKRAAIVRLFSSSAFSSVQGINFGAAQGASTITFNAYASRRTFQKTGASYAVSTPFRSERKAVLG